MRAPSLLLSFALLPVVAVGAPVVSAPAPDPHPVAPVVQEVALDTAALRTASAGTGPRTLVLTGEQATRPFSTLGVTWRPDPAVGDVVVQARTRTDGVWTGWTELEVEGLEPVEGTPDVATAREGTAPYYAGDSDGVQVRLDVLGGADPADVRLALVDPGDSDADAQTAPTLGGSTAEAAASRPVIRTRAEWGADESLRSGSPSYNATIEAVTIHHTASSNDYTPAEVPGIIRGFYAYHVKSQGWSDIGYNVLVDKFGTAWEGRAGGLERPVMGAHAGGFNTDTAGVSMIGTHVDVEPSAALKETVAQVTAWKLGLHGRDPKGKVTLTSRGSTKYSSGTQVTLPRIFGHKDVSSTACPGERGYAALPALRDRAAVLAGAPTPDQPAPPKPRPDPFGALEQAVPGPGSVRVTGWAIDPDASTFTTVVVSADGTRIGAVVAKDSRPDVAAAHPPYSPNHGFSASFVVPAGRRTVCATAIDQGEGNDVELGCLPVDVPAPVAPAPPPAPTAAVRPAAPPPRAVDHSCPAGRVPPAGFRDTAGSAHAATIDCVVWWAVAQGTAPGSYTPGGTVTRAQMATFLVRLLAASGAALPPAPTTDAFRDIAGTGVHRASINRLAAAGIAQGYSGGDYRPSAPVSRAQMATYLVRTIERRTGEAMPTGGDYWADDDGNAHEPAISKVTRAAVSGGTSATAYGPAQSTQRGQMASFVARTLDLLVEGGDVPPHA